MLACAASRGVFPRTTSAARSALPTSHLVVFDVSHVDVTTLRARIRVSSAERSAAAPRKRRTSALPGDFVQNGRAYLRRGRWIPTHLGQLRLLDSVAETKGSCRAGPWLLANARCVAEAPASAAAATAAKGRIWLRVEQPVEEEIDRLRHQLHGIGSVVVEGIG